MPSRSDAATRVDPSARPSEAPLVSVVIPTWRRETRLAFALDGLAEQTLDRDLFEVIVVRAEGGLDGELAGPSRGLEARFLVSPTPGAAAQRNLGSRAARASLVAFMDDDCRPAPDWLEGLLHAQAGPGTILQGRTEPDPDERPVLWGLARTMKVTELSGWYPTCNIAYPRALLERLGGFDERFPGAYGEDTDLALRALESGARAVYVDGAVVWHAVHPRPLPKALKETWRRDVTPIVVKRHPIHREELYLRVFFSWRHATLLLALAGIVAFRRRHPLLAVAASYPYVKRTYAWRPSARKILRGATYVPVRATVDIAEILVVVRAGIKHRVLIL